MSKGPNHRRKIAIEKLNLKIMRVKADEIDKGDNKNEIERLNREIDKIHDKLKRRGEWKHKTKRSMSSAQARSKSKKGKSSGKSGPKPKKEE